MRSLFAAIFFMTATSLSAQVPSGPQALEYDRNALLDILEVSVNHRGDVAVHDISYASPKGGRVPAYLVVPEGKGPFAAVIWGHWYWPNSAFFNREEFLEEAVMLAHTGVVSLLTTGPGARPGHVQDTTPLSEQQIADRVQAIVDMRRGADLLLARKDVDPQRLAYVGHSYNAEVGANLSGLDKRFKAFVLMAGSMSDEVDLASEEYKQDRLKVGPEKFDAFITKYNWLDRGKFVSHAAPAVVFLQYGTHDVPFLSPERARQYAAVVSEPKRFQLYDAPHALNAAARRERIAFLCEQLKLKPLSAEQIAAIPELFQPTSQNP
jgi:dienelactone hydrolase